jgi:hypothetical protein
LKADLQFDGSVFWTGHDQRLWRYVHGAFVPDGEAQLRARVRHFLGDKYTAHYAREMLSYVEAESVHKPLPHPQTRG